MSTEAVKLQQDLVITEGVASVYFYHLSEPERKTVSLCGAQTMHTSLPLSSWGFKSKHIPEGYCETCQTLGSSDPAVLFAGLSRGTLLRLSGLSESDYSVTHAAHRAGKCKRFAGWLTSPDGRPLINTEPVFRSAISAELHVRRLLKLASIYA